MSNLAACHGATGKPEKAVPLLEEALRLRKERFGPEHPEVVTSMKNLATAYRDVRRPDRAVPLLEEVLRLEKARLEVDHPDVVTDLSDLASAYLAVGKPEKALPLLEQAYPASRKVRALRWVGPALLEAYAGAKKAAEAAKLARELAGDARKALPKDSPQLAGMLAILGLELLEAGAFADAEPLLRESLTIRERAEPEAWTTFNTRSMLGGALLGQKKHDEAAPLLRSGYRGMVEREDEIPPKGRARLREAVDRLADFYAATGKPELAKKYRAERAKYPEVLPRPLEER
jgi:tetratricopeptide (TPR) repeat protein